jgi:ubiquitin carboxyl-terminal hydrolase 5/13
MLEMEIELNMKHYGEISALTESGKALKPMRGPGITGIVNLGNSCYLNSLMQALFTIPDFQERFTRNADKYFEAATDPLTDFNLQM